MGYGFPGDTVLVLGKTIVTIMCALLDGKSVGERSTMLGYSVRSLTSSTFHRTYT